MKQIIKYSCLTILAILGSLFITIEVLAVPTLPSSFYGSVKVNNASVADGTLIQALIDGQVYAEGYTQTYQGESVYSIDVKGDDTDTPAQDGGREGDTIQFKIGGIVADQTGVWHSGTNVLLNLTTSATEPVATPQETPTPYPTQTAIVKVQPSPMPTIIRLASLTPTTIVQPSLVATQLVQPSPVASPQTQASQTSVASDNATASGSANSATLLIIIIVLVVVVVAVYILLLLRKKKM
jgi:hypothetical protein